MKETVSKRKAKRACIDCHFLAEIQNDTEEAGLEPYEMEPKICHYYVEADRREPIKRNDYSWILLPLVHGDLEKLKIDVSNLSLEEKVTKLAKKKNVDNSQI